METYYKLGNLNLMKVHLGLTKHKIRLITKMGALLTLFNMITPLYLMIIMKLKT